MRACVLGAGTEIGKTYVACALLRQARAQGLSVRALKPVMSGYAPDDLAVSDAGRLLEACGAAPSRENVSRMCLHAFEAPLAPNLAARRAGASLDYDSILAFATRAVETDVDFLLIEGAGGVLSPLTDTHLNADLAADLGFPVILVAANYLGAVSHTLTALEALERRNIDIAGIAISQPTDEFAYPADLAAELARWTTTPCVLFGHHPVDNAHQEEAGRMLSVLRG